MHTPLPIPDCATPGLPGVSGGRRSAGRRRLATLCGLALWLAGGTGCYDQRYNQRMDTTTDLFNHMDKVAANVGGEIAVPEGGPVLRIKPPRQFVKIPPPPPTKKGERPPTDLRQPDYLPIELPGLMMAAKARLQIDVAGKAAEHDAYMYVLGNYSAWASSKGANGEPEKFRDGAIKRLAQALQIGVDEKKWLKVSYPEKFDLVQKVEYLEQVLNPERSIGDVKMKFMPYLYTVGATQVIVLFVIPEGVANKEQLPDRIAASLETLRANDVKRGGGGGGATPTAGGGAF